MPTCVIYFDLENDSMTTEEYYNYCVQSLYIDNLYHIVFKVNNLEYPALFEAESKSTTFYDITKSIDLDNNYYLQLALNGAVNIKTTGVEFPYIKMREMSALNTIFYIETFFYKMLSIDSFEIVDIAEGICNLQKYKLFVYRIFATNNSLNKLSIYFKYCKTFDDITFLGTAINITELSNILYTLRQYTFNDINTLCTSLYDRLGKNLNKRLEENIKNTIKTFQKNIEEALTIHNLNSNVFMNSKLVDILSKFITYEKCDVYAKLLNSIESILTYTDIYNTTYNKLKKICNFKINIKNSIYYPGVSGGKYHIRYIIQHKHNTIHHKNNKRKTQKRKSRK